jgi:hypothetical protein
VEALSPKEFKEEDGVRLVDEFADLSAQKNALDEMIEAVKQDLIEYAKKLGVEVVFGSDEEGENIYDQRNCFSGKAFS